MSINKITDSNYAETLAGKKAVVKFYADWCGSCRLFSPKFESLAEQDNMSGFIFLETDAENNPSVRATAEVSSLPYFAIYENGQFLRGVSTAKVESLEKLILA
jgi:thioredoxin 1